MAQTSTRARPCAHAISHICILQLLVVIWDSRCSIHLSVLLMVQLGQSPSAELVQSVDRALDGPVQSRPSAVEAVKWLPGAQSGS